MSYSIASVHVIAEYTSVDAHLHTALLLQAADEKRSTICIDIKPLKLRMWRHTNIIRPQFSIYNDLNSLHGGDFEDVVEE
jgi:hypothetical protein